MPTLFCNLARVSVLVLMASVMACGTSESIFYEPPNLARGEQIFSETCAYCHGQDGTGSPQAPSLYDRVPYFSDQQLVSIIQSGSGPMPAQEIYSEEEVSALLGYLRYTFGNTHAARPQTGEHDPRCTLSTEIRR